MRRIDIFCASQAATSIRLSMDEGSSSSSPSSSSTIHLSGGRAIDRHNPIIRDSRRLLLPPCTSQQPPPIAPIPYKQLHHKARKINSSKSNDQTNKKSSSKPISTTDQKKKSTTSGNPSHEGEIIRKSWAKPGDFISPAASSRYLLGDTAFLDVLSDFDPVLGLVSVDSTKSQPVKPEESSASNSIPPSSSSSSSSRSPDQVVVLRVSLHCKGCEGKLRKHISRMQGVTSFNIDFAAKKVTVVGDVTPLGVLASISKVKSAQLWTPPAMSSSSVPAASSTTYSEIKKSKGVVVV